MIDRHRVTVNWSCGGVFVYYKEESIFEQYSLEILDTYKGRGAVFAITNMGKVYLKEYAGSMAKADFLAKILNTVNKKGMRTETVVPTKEGENLCRDMEGFCYMLRKWCDGKECNTGNWEEILASVDSLACLHNYMNEAAEHMPNVLKNDEGKLLASYEKHTRELRTIKNYVKSRKSKSEFEKEFLELYPKFDKQANQIMEGLRNQKEIRAGFGICHGDFNQHNIVFWEGEPSIISFDNICYDVQVSDLARFMRKILEKNNWNMGLGMEMVRTYEQKKSLSSYETEQIYLRLAYPEKFWKIANHYYNANKAWGFGRYLEKLEKMKLEEENRERFLEFMKHFAYS